MKHYSALIELDHRELTPAAAESLLDTLDAYSPAIGNSPRGWAYAQITVPADTLAQATQTAIAVVAAATGHEPIHADVMTEEEFDARQGFVPTPELIGVVEAAGMLGVTQQAVKYMINHHQLTGQKVGNSLILTRHEVEAFKAQREAKKK